MKLTPRRIQKLIETYHSLLGHMVCTNFLSLYNHTAEWIGDVKPVIITRKHRIVSKPNKNKCLHDVYINKSQPFIFIFHISHIFLSWVAQHGSAIILVHMCWQVMDVSVCEIFYLSLNIFSGSVSCVVV